MDSCDQKNENCFSYERDESRTEHVRELSITVNKKKYKQIKSSSQPGLICRSSISYKFKKQIPYSNLLKKKKCENPATSSHAEQNKQNKYKTNLFLSKYTVNMVFERPFNTALSSFNHSNQTACKIYRCQVLGPYDTCCCSCNSDAIFEVMKGLYNCYKKKNCLNCNCILCGDQKLQGGIKIKNERLSEKFAGLLTLPKRKSQAKRESKEPAKHVVPVPEGQMRSKIKLTVKAKDDLGLPVESKTKTIPPLDPPKKELRTPPKEDLRTPPKEELGTPPKEELIQKNEEPKTTQGDVTQQDVKLAEALTHSQRKIFKHKEKILKNLIKDGLPLPIGRTPSEKKLIDIVRVQFGLPHENKNLREVVEIPPSKASVITLLDGKPRNKDHSLVAGDPIPKGETLLKRDQINKMVNDSVSKHKLMIDKMRHRKSSGLLTPLKGKTLEQKEKILIDLVKAGLPLPESKTASEKYLVDRIQNKVGVAPQRNLSSVSIALENMTQAEKEIILKRLKDAGLPLPEPERKPKDEDKLTPLGEIPNAEKHKKSTEEDILIPLQGLSKAEKHKIVKRLAEDGVPLPEGKTVSERSLLRNVKAELGMGPTQKRRDHKSVIVKAKTEGLFSPISDKPHEEKVRIIRGLAKAELPVPKGKTPSEKNLIKRIKDEFHWLTNAMHYETGKKVSKNYEEVKNKRMNVTQNYQAIIKTTTCERGCDSNKRNIKFKNSHPKFKVTFSDVPTFCDRPVQCIPGGKRGYFVDNEGIKIIVGSAVGAPSISRGYINQIMQDGLASKAHSSNINRVYSKHLKISKTIRYIENYSRNYCGNRNRNIFLQSSKKLCNRCAKKCVGLNANMKRLQKSAQICRNVRNLKSKSTAGSSASILVINSEASLTLNTSSSNSTDTIVTSDWSSDITSHSKHCSDIQSFEELSSISSVDGPTSEELIDQPAVIGDRKMNIRTITSQLEYAVFRLSEEKRNFVKNKSSSRKRPSAVTGNIVLFNRFSRKFDISKLLDKILARKRFTQAPSLFVVVPTSDEEEDYNKVIDSTSICSVETPVVANSDTMTAISSVHGLQEECGNGKKFYMQEVLSATRDTEKAVQKDSLRVLKYVNMDMKNKYCQFVRTNDNRGGYVTSVTGVAVDTTLDRPCCCLPKISSTTYVIESATSRNCYVANVSRQVTPLLLKDRRPKWCRFTNSSKASKIIGNGPMLVSCLSNNTQDTTTRWRNRKYRLRSSSVSINESLNKYNYLPAPCECNPNGFDLSSYQTAKVTVAGNYGGSLETMRARRCSIRNTGGGQSSSSSTSDERRHPSSITSRNGTGKRRPSVTIREDRNKSSKHIPDGASSKKQSKNGVSKAEKKSSLKKITSDTLSKIRKKYNESSSSAESSSGASSGESASSFAKKPRATTRDACFGTTSQSDLKRCPGCPPQKTRCCCKVKKTFKCKCKPRCLCEDALCRCKPHCECPILIKKCPKIETRKCGCQLVKGKNCACVEHYVYGGPRPGPTPWTRSRGMVTDFRGPAILHARKVCEYKRVLCDEDIETCECPKKVCETNNLYSTCPCGEHSNIISNPGEGPKPSTKTVGAVTDVMGSDIFRLELRFCPVDPTIKTKEKKKCKKIKGCVCQDLNAKGALPITPPCDEDCTRMPKPEKKKICCDKLKKTDPCSALEKLKDQKRDPKKNVLCQTDPPPPKKTALSKLLTNIGKISKKNDPCCPKDKVKAVAGSNESFAAVANDSNISKPSNPSNPSIPSIPSNPPNPPNSPNSSNPSNPSDPCYSSYPSNPSDPCNSSYPSNSSNPSNRSSRSNPYNPSYASYPSNSSNPSYPSNPPNPPNPTDPSNPSNPEGLENLSNPSNPSNPPYPSDPSNPSYASYPSNTSNPAYPSNSANPAYPYYPSPISNPSNPSNPPVIVRKNVIMCKCKPFCKCVNCTSKNPRKPRYYEDDYIRPCSIPIPKKPCECTPFCRCLSCTLLPKCIPPKQLKSDCGCKKAAAQSKKPVTCNCKPNCECGILKKTKKRHRCECKEKPVKCECIRCLCRKRPKSKKKSVTLIDPKDGQLTCAIDEPEPEPVPVPVPIPEPEPEPEQMQIIELPAEFLPEGQVYETVGPSCAWIKDTEALLKIRSELTVISSGFKAFKTKRLPQEPEPQVEMDFAQAIRYFAKLNPVRFKELMIQERNRIALEEKQKLDYIEEMKKEAELAKLEAEKRRLSAVARKDAIDKMMKYIESLVGEKIFKVIKYLFFSEEEAAAAENLEISPTGGVAYSEMGAEADLDPAYWYPDQGFKLTIGYNGGATSGNPNPNCI